MVWAALFLNVLAFSTVPTVAPIPQIAGQLITQGSLPVALLLALLMNPKGVLRPNVYLAAFTIAAVLALAVSIHSEFVVGSTFRAFRFLGFLLALWLISPWFGRRDMTLLRCHRVCLVAVMSSVVLGAAISPGLAFSFDGRLTGVLWPIPATQVAHYAAVLFGTTTILWMCQVLSGRRAALILTFSGAVLVATHTRTALIGLLAGLLVGGASLFLGNARVRRTTLTLAGIALVTVALFANELRTWALRGQDSGQITELTGRTKVWSAVMSQPRPALETWFGSGLSNMSFNGLPIDSNWVATFQDQGWFGVGIQSLLFLLLLVVAIGRVRGPHKAIGLFLLIYCLFASITEAGLDGPSPYLLDLTVAASLLISPDALGQT
jgi:O-antigen ligase